MILPYCISFQRARRRFLSRVLAQDEFFEDVFHVFQDFGIDVRFPVFQGSVGAYQPFALNTERLDTLQKQEQFTNGFWRIAERGEMRALVMLPFFQLKGRAVHDFIHELMHLYQDMYGLYFVPLKEQGVMPVCLDAKSDIVAILFCEAWAQTQTIRMCYDLGQKGFRYVWRGALSHPDFGDFARFYAQDIDDGLSEDIAMVRCFKHWYKGAHRTFYERHALDIHRKNFERLMDDVGFENLHDVQKNLRRLTYSSILERLPNNKMTAFFKNIDWNDAVFHVLQTSEVSKQVAEIEEQYGSAQNENIHDIKCGAPIYIWNRLRVREIETSEVPAELYEMAQKI